LIFIINDFLFVEYSYNPCKPFSEGSACINVAVCQISIDGALTFILGEQDSAVWDAGSDVDKPSISYAYGEKRVTVSLECGTEGNDDLEALGEEPMNNYKFRLTHKCACWNGCKGE
jgi:hypothetical protein